MKKSNKKGFTIVELVIVIAVIAILAGVMIPTFGGVIETAQESAAMQKVTAAYKDAYAVALSDDGVVNAADGDIESDGITFTCADDGTMSIKSGAPAGFTFTYDDGAWTAEKDD